MLKNTGWLCYGVTAVLYIVFVLLHIRWPGYTLAFPRMKEEGIQLWRDRTDALYGAFLWGVLVNAVFLFAAIAFPLYAIFFIKCALSLGGVTIALCSYRVDSVRQSREAMALEKTIVILLLLALLFTSI